jgi:hypothetical protein
VNKNGKSTFDTASLKSKIVILGEEGVSLKINI